MWVEFDVLTADFSASFPPWAKTNTSKFHFDLQTVDEELLLNPIYFVNFIWINVFLYSSAHKVGFASKSTGSRLTKSRGTVTVVTLNCWISVEFDDLWKFHAPVNIVEGFDISLFDKLIEVRKTYSFTFRPGKWLALQQSSHYSWNSRKIPEFLKNFSRALANSLNIQFWNQLVEKSLNLSIGSSCSIKKGTFSRKNEWESYENVSLHTLWLRK